MTRFVRSLFSVALTLLFLAVVSGHAQTYTDLYDFTQPTGSYPISPGMLAQGQDGNLYGSMPSGGSGPPWPGTVFSYSVGSGTFSDLYFFNGNDGYGAASGLSLGFDGNFYGTTYLQSGSTYGEIYKITPAGALKVLYRFTNGTDGAYPFAPPIQAPDGNLYGVTYNGNNPGKAYRITPSGTYTVIATLPSKTIAPLIVGVDGKLYGTTQTGGKYNGGTVFQLSTSGKLKIIYNFNASGVTPTGPVMQGKDKKLYGTTPWGGTSGIGVVYQLTTAGKYAVLHNFTGTADGSNSASGLVQGSDGYLYGVADAGGATGYGTFFKVNTKGTIFKVLHVFDGKTSGGNPLSTPMLHTSGLIYGTANTGPKEGNLYSMDVGLKPFASLFVTWSGKVGTSVPILGQGFLSATGVQFGTTSATFQVVNDTYMIATVPAGATTGEVTVLEPSGSLVTPQIFKVLP